MESFTDSNRTLANGSGSPSRFVMFPLIWLCAHRRVDRLKSKNSKVKFFISELFSGAYISFNMIVKNYREVKDFDQAGVSTYVSDVSRNVTIT